MTKMASRSPCRHCKVGEQPHRPELQGPSPFELSIPWLTCPYKQVSNIICVYEPGDIPNCYGSCTYRRSLIGTVHCNHASTTKLSNGPSPRAAAPRHAIWPPNFQQYMMQNQAAASASVAVNLQRQQQRCIKNRQWRCF
jgi:hypothetical protein